MIRTLCIEFRLQPISTHINHIVAYTHPLHRIKSQTVVTNINGIENGISMPVKAFSYTILTIIIHAIGLLNKLMFPLCKSHPAIHKLALINLDLINVTLPFIKIIYIYKTATIYNRFTKRFN